MANHIDRKSVRAMQSNGLALLNLGFQADWVKLPASGSYQTLSRRIEAMKHMQKFSRKQVVLISGALAALAVLTLVPWRVVAQDPGPVRQSQPQNDPRAATPAQPDKAGPTKTTDSGIEKSVAEK